jgi:hypothetical protein
MFTFQKAVDINKVLFDANILTANNEDAWQVKGAS